MSIHSTVVGVFCGAKAPVRSVLIVQHHVVHIFRYASLIVYNRKKQTQAKCDHTANQDVCRMIRGNL
jgi:hypothetical protein